MKKNICIIGCSGYTASELIRIALNHPNINIANLVGNSKAGQEMPEIYPYLKFANLPIIEKIEKVDFSKIDLVFCCLPHGETKNIIPKLPKNIKIIDLSSDFRITDKTLYQKYYETPLNEEFKGEIAYGLSEIYKTQIKEKRIIACPGCYPTSILLPLFPLLKEISLDEIIIDSKTGLSGAGRKIIEQNLFCEINENSFSYNPTKHRHLAEIIEQLNISSESVQFTPQVIPTNRGIISNIYINAKISAKEIRKILQEYYQDSPFIRINQEGEIAKLRNIIGTNFCEISVIDTNIKNKKLIISTIDNLTKGSSGQAIQNFNILYNLAEDTALTNLSLYP